MASDDETSSSSSSVPEDAASAPTFHRVVELEIADFARVKNRNNIRMTASSTNDNLASYGSELSKSRWRLRVDTSVLAANGSKEIGATIELTSPCEMTVKASVNFGVISCRRGRLVANMGKVEDVELTVLPSHHGSVSKSNPRLEQVFVSHNNSDLHSDIIIRAEISFQLISGGDADAPCNALESLGRSYTKFGSPDYTITSSDDVVFRVHRNHLAAMSPLLAELMEEEVDEMELDDLDGLQLAAILRTLYIQEHRDLESAGQVLIAARNFKLETLEKECLRSYLEGIEPENAYAALEFAKELSIQDIIDKAVVVIRNTLQTVNSSDSLIFALGKISSRTLEELKQDISKIMTDGARTFSTTEIAKILQVVRGKNFLVIEDNFTAKLSVAVKDVSMDKAVETLKIVSDQTLDQFKKQLIQHISENVKEFAAAGGFSELSESNQPDLIRAVEDGVTERDSKKPRVK